MVEKLILCLIFLFHPFNVNSNKTSNVIIINFQKSHIEIDVDTHSNIELHCSEPCIWIIPKRINQSNEIVLTKNKLLINMALNSLINVTGNISACREHVREPRLEIYEIPKCCPCCSWYNIHLCKSFYKRIESCTTISFYTPTKVEDEIQNTIIYDNDVYLLPCQMHLANLKDDLLIYEDYTSGKVYLKYENGTLVTKETDVIYYPTAGLCINTSKLKNEYFKCQYSNGFSTIFLIKLNFKREHINNKLMLINDNSNVLLLNGSEIKMLENSTLRIQCQVHYESFTLYNLIICMKFEIINNQSSGYNCTKFRGKLSPEMLIYSSQIRNGSKLICSNTNPSREISTHIESIIYQYSSEILIIKNFEFLNNRVFKVFSSNKTFSLQIFYYSIPTSGNFNCTALENVVMLLEIVCNITFAEQCECQISTEKLFEKKLTANLSVSISNNKFKQTVNVILIPVYINLPQVKGLTAKLEFYKQLWCDVEASNPINVTWNIHYNKNEMSVYHSTTRNLTLILNNTYHICVSCAVTNDAGSIVSEKVCKSILDVNINDNSTVQIYLVNATIWVNDKAQQINEIHFQNSRNSEIKVLDLNPVYIKCASRIKNLSLEIQSSLSQVHINNLTEIHSNYTRQVIYEIDAKFLATMKKPVKFSCRQNNTYVDSTYFIRILETLKPEIQFTCNRKLQFIINQDIPLTFGILSFPPAQINIFRIRRKNNSYYYNEKNVKKIKINKQFINLTYSQHQLVIFNVSYQDAGQYLIQAFNIRGKDDCLLSLELLKIPLQNFKVYIILGSLFVIAIICLITVTCYCKRSGYTVPIIQIQNNLYKSLENDSLQLLNLIWSDPLERNRWTISPSSRIKFKERIGGGNYGVVHTGILKGVNSSFDERVALKYPIVSKADKNDEPHGPSKFCQISLDCFINEIRILSTLSNGPNIIKMYGCAIFQDWMNEKNVSKEPMVIIVLEFCSNYSLSEYLSKNADNFVTYSECAPLIEANEYIGMVNDRITLVDLKQMALGIATGLKYLNVLNIIHRDLATRNILLDENKVPKICDFGLAIELDNNNSVNKTYQILTYNKELPYKILAPEALEYKTFYLESDIWSFSIMLWEIFNLEKQPLFPNIATPSELLHYIHSRLKSGGSDNILSMPQYADDSIWDLIKACWRLNPFDRPSAQSVHNRLLETVLNGTLNDVNVKSCCQSVTYDAMCLDWCKTPTNATSFDFQTMSSHTNWIASSQEDFCHDNLIDESLL